MIQQAIDRLIDTEGGYVDHPNDRGGPTNFGITLATLSAYRGSPQTAEDVKALELPEARGIYLTNYWVKPGFSKLVISDVCAEMIFDAAVNHGESRAVKFLQKAINVEADGILGPNTLEAAMQQSSNNLACYFMAARVEFYGKIITKDHSQAVFAHGWMRRAAGFIEDIRLA